MKILDTSAISDNSQMPLKKGTLQFFQDSHKETTAAAWKALIGPQYNPAILYVMTGGINTGVYPYFNISAGAIFYNDEVYIFDAASFTVSGSNTVLLNTNIVQYSTDADPVTFTDKTVRNIHNDRRMQITQGNSGSGIVDFSQLSYLNFSIPPQVVLKGTGQATVTGVYPNLEIYVPPNNTILYSDTYHIGDIQAGGTLITINLPITLPTVNYYIFGTLASNNPPSMQQNDNNVTWAISARTATSFAISLRETLGGYVQNINFDYIIFAK